MGPRVKILTKVWAKEVINGKVSSYDVSTYIEDHNSYNAELLGVESKKAIIKVKDRIKSVELEAIRIKEGV